MAAVYYTARRALVSGHTVGDNYSFSFTPMSMDRITETIVDTSISIAGNSQHMVSRREINYQIVTDYYTVGTSEFDSFYEFLESVDEREVFTFDELGIVGASVSIIPAELTANYSRSRLSNKNIYQFTFNLRVLPA